MFHVTEKKYGLLEFKQRKSNSWAKRKGLYLPGSTAFHAREPFVHITYQHLERENFSIWRSHFKVNENIILHLTSKEPWLGFRVLLKQHLHFFLNGQEINMMQGQINFTHRPITESTLYLTEGSIYETLDINVAPSFIRKSKIQQRQLSSFLNTGTEGNLKTLNKRLKWCSIKLLDTIDYFMNHPDEEGVATEVVKQALQTSLYKDRHTREITHQQFENLDRVRQEIKKNYLIHLPLSQLSKKSQMNVTYIKEMFTQVFGLTPYQYLIYERLKVAKELLKRGPELTYTQVARLAGFSSYNNFRRTFFEKEKLTLKEWGEKSELILLLLIWEIIIEEFVQ